MDLSKGMCNIGGQDDGHGNDYMISAPRCVTLLNIFFFTFSRVHLGLQNIFEVLLQYLKMYG